MERNYEQEIVGMFGTRLKLIYELNEHTLPREIAVSLDRLRKREQGAVHADNVFNEETCGCREQSSDHR